MSSTARLIFVGLIFAALAGGAFVVRDRLTCDEVLLPKRNFNELPMQFGEWHGEESTLDPEVEKVLAKQALWIVNRTYRHPRLGTVVMHLALFKQASDGTLHSPMDCYRGAGWNLQNEVRVPFETGDGTAIPVSLSTWENHGQNQKLRILYWFALGDDILYNRSDLLAAYWKLAGQKVWPPLVKVLMQTNVTADPAADDRRLQDFMKELTRWLDEATKDMQPPKNP